MNAIGLGLIAACAWAVHDLLVRMVSQKVSMFAALFWVLLAGLGFHLCIMLTNGGLVLPIGRGLWLSVASGMFFLVASLGLYGAFQRGPVRLVAPIISSYPILSVTWAALGGAEVSGLQWLAVLGIVLGVSMVAALSDADKSTGHAMGPTILLAGVSSLCFAGTFALGQMASAASSEMAATLVTRATTLALLFGIITALRLPIWTGGRAAWVLTGMGALDAVALLSVLAAGGLANPQYASVASAMFGLLTVVLAWAFLRERMSVAQWFGCLLAFCGIGYLAL